VVVDTADSSYVRLGHATGAVLAASEEELAPIVEWTRPFWFGAALGHFVCLAPEVRVRPVRHESGECITMYNPAPLAVRRRHLQREGKTNVRVKQ
jgi:hypothetical protein